MNTLLSCILITSFSHAVEISYQVFNRIPAKWHADAFYHKAIDCKGLHILASKNVDDYALKETAYVIEHVLQGNEKLRNSMIQAGCRITVMAYNEFTTDIPEYKNLTPKEFWDKRARGLGGSATDSLSSCAEENVLSYPGDPYSTECILIHEFAHSIHQNGMRLLDSTFDARLKSAYDDAIKKGLWQKTYAATNHAEYFAEGVQSWFNNNRENDNEHNFVNTRDELKHYDPALAELVHEVIGENSWSYTKAIERLTEHMKGFKPEKSPTFHWREEKKNGKK